MTNLLLLLILILLWLDFYIRNNILIKKIYRKCKNKITKQDCFSIQSKTYWEKAMDDLKKTL